MTVDTLRRLIRTVEHQARTAKARRDHVAEVNLEARLMKLSRMIEIYESQS